MKEIKMSKQMMKLGILCLLACALVFTGCCGKKNVKKDPEDGTKVEYNAPEIGETVVDEEIVNLDIPPADRSRIPDAEPVSIPELQMVYFEYNKFRLTEDTVAILNNNLNWISANPGVFVRIEGHCDERGSEEYNQNLGEKRANAIRNYMVTRGASPDYLITISYGETRPVAVGSSEDAWLMNRRGEFKVWQ
jgi:peptidoglycan-associated lipoprotein